MNLPKARTEKILEQNLKNETLIYDLNTHKAFNLNETLTAVYKACDGHTSFADLRRKHKFTDDFIFLALDELKASNLLVENTGYAASFSHTNRREAIRKVGLTTMLALPLIIGIVAPQAINAASGASVDTTRGNYNQQCVPGAFGAYCNGDLRCVPTTSSEDRCCAYSSATGSVRHYPRDSVTETNGPISIRPEYAVTSDDTSCQYNLACCDGSSATGTCTYEPDTTNEYSDEDRAGFEQSGFYPYLQKCTCTCP